MSVRFGAVTLAMDTVEDGPACFVLKTPGDERPRLVADVQGIVLPDEGIDVKEKVLPAHFPKLSLEADITSGTMVKLHPPEHILSGLLGNPFVPATSRHRGVASSAIEGCEASFTWAWLNAFSWSASLNKNALRSSLRSCRHSFCNNVLSADSL